MTQSEQQSYWEMIFSRSDSDIVPEPASEIEEDWHRSGDE